MESIYLSSVGVTAKITANRKTLDSILSDDFTRHYIPDVSFDGKDADVHVTAISGQDRISKIDNSTIYLKDGLDGRSFVVSTEYLLEKARQEKYGVCTLNSSSVQKNGNGVIFYGAASNLGKSTFALDLKSIGFNHYSDEKTLIDLERMKLVGGSRSIPLRKKFLRDRLMESNKDGFHKIDSNSDNEPNVSMFILPHYDNGLKEPKIDKLEDLDLFWGLSGEFSRRIRGTSRYINKFSHQLPSIDTEDLTDWRVNALKELAKKSKGYYFQGNSQQLIEFVNNEIK
jgi:hypothetical protein